MIKEKFLQSLTEDKIKLVTKKVAEKRNRDKNIDNKSTFFCRLDHKNLKLKEN